MNTFNEASKSNKWEFNIGKLTFYCVKMKSENDILGECDIKGRFYLFDITNWLICFIKYFT